MTGQATHGEHRAIRELIPWYVNGTIGDRDRLRVDAHVALCARCRDELTTERTLFQGMSGGSAVEYMPAASLKRLNAALDALDGRSTPDTGRASAGSAEPRRSVRWASAAAAGVVAAVLLLGLGKLAREPGRRDSPADYRTVTTSAAHAPGEVIRAVFSSSVTLQDLQSILDEAGLRIIAGPTEAGVYSLAATSRRPVSVSLGLLRAHAAVRFAERTDAGPGTDIRGAPGAAGTDSAAAAAAAAGTTDGRDAAAGRGAAP